MTAPQLTVPEPTEAADPQAIPRLHALIVAALAIADRLELHAAGIALDTARIAVERLPGAPSSPDRSEPLPPS